MGEVYRCRDSRLDRIVAIKILPSHLSDSPEAKQRFDREARVVSSMSHPNICTLYDVGSQNGTDFLVMEFLEGETDTEGSAADGAGPFSVSGESPVGFDRVSAKPEKRPNPRANTAEVHQFDAVFNCISNTKSETTILGRHGRKGGVVEGQSERRWPTATEAHNIEIVTSQAVVAKR